MNTSTKTQLKSIRFPKVVIETLDKYSRDNYGLSFSKFILHMAIEKVEDIKSTSKETKDLIKSYLEAEESIRNGTAEIVSTPQDLKNLLDSWKEDEQL